MCYIMSIPYRFVALCLQLSVYIVSYLIIITRWDMICAVEILFINIRKLRLGEATSLALSPIAYQQTNSVLVFYYCVINYHKCSG